MEAVVSSRSTRPAWLGLRVGVRLPSTGAWILGFAPVLYLALKGGGYDLVVYSQVGVAVWWIVLCGVLSGVLPAVRIDRVGWLVLGVLFSYAAWTALGATWSSSVERSVDELGRVSAYAGFFVLGLCVLDASRLRHLLDGMACAFAIVGVLAVLSGCTRSGFPVTRCSLSSGRPRGWTIPSTTPTAWESSLRWACPCCWAPPPAHVRWPVARWRRAACRCSSWGLC